MAIEKEKKVHILDTEWYKIEMPVGTIVKCIGKKKYFKKNGLYEVEEFFSGYRSSSIKVKGMKGWHQTYSFVVVPAAILREKQIDSILDDDSAGIQIITGIHGEREIDKVENKNKLLAELMLKKMSYNLALIPFDRIVEHLCQYDTRYAIKPEDFEDFKKLTFEEVLNLSKKIKK